MTEISTLIFPAIAIAVLAAVHLLAHKLTALRYMPRSRWLSAAGGASVAYVFLHLLPELSEAQRRNLSEIGFLESELVWLFALAGLTIFYILETRFRQSTRSAGAGDGHHREYRLHLIAFAAYNATIGYLLIQREDTDTTRLLLFTIAMGLHFLVTDSGLRESFRQGWLAEGRWVVAAALVAGGTLASAVALPEAAVSSLTAFLGGGMILNVLKEELPEDRQSRLVPFVTGAFIYSVLLIAAR